MVLHPLLRAMATLKPLYNGLPGFLFELGLFRMVNLYPLSATSAIRVLPLVKVMLR